MVQYLTAYALTAVIFLAIDFAWLSWIARNFYFERLGDLLMERPNLGAAAAFYAVYVIGVVVFSVAPALKADSVAHALIYGALFGFFAYSTYDMTNFAILRNWPLDVSLVDIAWGTALTGTAATGGFLATRALFNA